MDIEALALSIFQHWVVLWCLCAGLKYLVALQELLVDQGHVRTQWWERLTRRGEYGECGSLRTPLPGMTVIIVILMETPLLMVNVIWVLLFGSISTLPLVGNIWVYERFWHCFRWQFGAVGSDVDRINEVTLRWARLVLGWVTVSGFNSRCG